MPQVERDEVDPAEIEAEEALRIAQEEMNERGSEFIGKVPDSVEEEMKKFEQGFSYRSPEKLADNPREQEPIYKEEETSHEKGFANLEDLSFVRLIDPVHIPSYLVEQMKTKLFNIEKFYEYLKIISVYQSENGPILNNTSFLYAMTNVKLRQVKGFLYMYLDILNNSLIISLFSIDKEYWNKGEAVNFMLSYAKQVMKDLSASRIVWSTKNVKTCELLGFTRMRETLMTFEGK